MTREETEAAKQAQIEALRATMTPEEQEAAKQVRRRFGS